MSAIALLVGIGVLSLAVVDYARSPADHRGIQIGSVFFPIGNSNPVAGGGHTPGSGGGGTTGPGGTSSPPPHATPPVTSGRYVIFSFSAGGNPGPVVASLPSIVGGVSWIFAWRDIEPQRGVYNWSRIDSALAAASASRRTSMIRVVAGFLSPTWEKPTVTFSFKPSGPLPFQTITMPIPWSPSFLADWTTFIRAYGARYNRDPRVWAVQMAGAGWQAEMNMGAWAGWTSTAPPPVGMGSDPATDAKVIGAWNTIIDAYRAGFPNKHSALDIGDPLSDGRILPAVMAHAQRYGANIYYQQNGLRAGLQGSYPTILRSASSWTTVGWQEWGGSNSASALQGSFVVALNTNAKYVEVYQNDCANAANVTALSYYAAR